MGIKDRGFGSMNKDKQRELSSRGGKAAHQMGTAYEWTPELARIAGLKGVKVRQAKAAKRAAE